MPDLHCPAVEAERAEDYALYAEFYQTLRPSPFPIFRVPGNMDARERYLTCALAEAGAFPLEVVHRFATRCGDSIICGLGEITAVDREELMVLQCPALGGVPTTSAL